MGSRNLTTRLPFGLAVVVVGDIRGRQSYEFLRYAFGRFGLMMLRYVGCVPLCFLRICDATPQHVDVFQQWIVFVEVKVVVRLFVGWGEEVQENVKVGVVKEWVMRVGGLEEELVYSNVQPVVLGFPDDH
jgi:hypothetical protein